MITVWFSIFFSCMLRSLSVIYTGDVPRKKFARCSFVEPSTGSACDGHWSIVHTREWSPSTGGAG